MERERLKEMSRFVMVGLVATAIHYAVYCMLLPQMSHYAAFTVGYVVSFLCNYVLSSRFTFRVGASVQRFVSFALSHAANYFIQMVLLGLFIWLGVSKTLAPLPVYAVAVPVNYLMVRFALTRRSREGDAYRLLLMAVGFGMLWLNLLDVPTLSDDMIYRFVWQTDGTAPVETIGSLGDLLRSQWTHYMTVNGRFVPHALAQAMLAFTPPVVMQVLDTLLFVLLIHLCATWTCKEYRTEATGECHTDNTDCTDRGTDRLWAAVLSTALLFVVFSGFRTTMLWGLGALNYLWPTVAVMALVTGLTKNAMTEALPPQTHKTHNAHKPHYAHKTHNALKVGLLLLALAAGWTHEAMSLPVSLAFAAWLIVHRRDLREKRLTTACMLLFMAGTALCLLSPGIWNRAAEGMSLTTRLVNGAVNAVSNVRVTWMLAVALLVTGISWKSRRKGEYLTQMAQMAQIEAEEEKGTQIAQMAQIEAAEKPGSLLWAHVKEHRYEYLVLTAALAITLLCGTTLERVAFYADFMAMLLLIALLKKTLTPRAKRWVAVGCCAVLLLAYLPAYMVRAENAESWQLAERQMKEPGRELIAVSTPQWGANRLTDWLREHYANRSFDFGFYCSYMGFDANDINMRCAARLYGKERLTFLPEDVVERIENDSTAYDAYGLDRNESLFLWRMADDRPVRSVNFILDKEDTSKLLPHQRLVAYQGDEYELDDFNFEVVKIGGQPFLVFTKPTTNICRRIKDIEIGY